MNLLTPNSTICLHKNLVNYSLKKRGKFFDEYTTIMSKLSLIEIFLQPPGFKKHYIVRTAVMHFPSQINRLYVINADIYYCANQGKSIF